MLGHGGSSAGSYLANPTSPIPSHCAVIILFQSSASYVVTGTLRVKGTQHKWVSVFVLYECKQRGYTYIYMQSDGSLVKDRNKWSLEAGSGSLESLAWALDSLSKWIRMLDP